jgi:ribosome biogenesis GTPase / thiamine phosphate phosphatase
VNQPRRAGLDEDDVRIRAARGSRPRTRRRPAHAEAARAFVTGVDRGRYRCVLGDRLVTAMKARELGRGTIVVGDTVNLAGDVTGAPGTLARVVRVEPRRSVLRRSADDTDPVERVIVANADQMLIVSSLADPAPRLRLIDRFLVAAYDAEIEPVLCLTKSDLASPDEVLPVYAPLGVRFIVLGRPLRDSALAELRGLLAGQISVLVGQSGVGKSTLVNMLIPDAARAVGAVSPVTGRGRHTSSSVVALPLPAPMPTPTPVSPPSPAGEISDLGISETRISDAGISDPGISGLGISGGGWIIDTPGLRSFGLGHMSAEDVLAAFPDLVDITVDCPPGCDHLGPDCALDAAAGADGPLAARLDSLRRLLRSLEGTEGLDPGDKLPADPQRPTT